jgi:hypothetical protein
MSVDTSSGTLATGVILIVDLIKEACSFEVFII